MTITENGAAAARDLLRDLAQPAQAAGRRAWQDWGTVDDGKQRRSFECHYTTKITGFTLRTIAPNH